MNIKSVSLKKELMQGFLGGLVAAIISLVLWSMGFFDVWEWKSWDWRQSVMAKPSVATDQICLIVVDQRSLDWMSETNGLTWPWPREIYSVVIEFCKRARAKALAFDVLFTEPSSYGVEDDNIFGKAIKDYGKVASAVFLKKRSGYHTVWPKDAASSYIDLQGIKEWLEMSAGKESLFPRAVMPIQDLTSTSAMLCNVQQEPDPDGIYRRARMVSIFDNHVVPNLGLGIYFAKDGNESRLYQKESGQISSDMLKIGNCTIALDRKGEAILKYRGPSGTHKAYSAAAVIQSEIEFKNSGSEKIISTKKDSLLNPEVFKDKYVFFSLSAPGLFDLRSSPVDSVYPGVEIQATMLDNFLAEDFIRDASIYSVIICVILWSATASVSIAFLKGATSLFFASILCLVLPVGISVLAYKTGIWLPLVVQESATATSIIFSLGISYAREGHQRRFIKNAFSQYLSPVFIEQLIQHPEKLKLGGERKELSIFFSDLQGFTSISEKLSPEELTSLLNNYLSAMTEIIHEEGGTVDKYEGDAIIAFWNAPLDVKEHQACAVRAALRCQKRLARMRPEIKKIIGTDMYMRIGLNTGVVVVGNMGSHSRFDYTMLGDAVNLAARLEGANKAFGTYTMISASTFKAITENTLSIPDRNMVKSDFLNSPYLSNSELLTDKDKTDKVSNTADINSNPQKSLPVNEFAFREIARLAVVGKKEAITVFEPMFSDQFEQNRDVYQTYNQGLQHFYNGQLQEAIEIFSAVADKDSPASAYVKKCNDLILENVSDPPPESWNGVWTMTRK